MAALAELATVGFDPVFGARPLKRAIQAAHREPARQGDPRRPLRGEGYDPDLLRRRGDAVRECVRSQYVLFRQSLLRDSTDGIGEGRGNSPSLMLSTASKIRVALCWFRDRRS